MNVKHRQHFMALDGWRGIAALSVALLHCPAYGYLYGLPFVRHSGLFVDFFFVLSGFVIAYNYADQIGSPRDLFSFMRRRFARLWPLHASILAFLFALELVKYAGVDAANTSPAFSGTTSIPALVSNLALAQGLGFHAGDTWNGPAVTISMEFYTYLVFAVGCLVGGSRVYSAAAVAFMAIGAVVALVFGSLADLGRFDMLRCVYNFAAGALVYFLYSRSTANPTKSVATAFECLIVLAVVAFVGTGYPRFDVVLVPLLFGALVYVFAFEKGALAAFARSAPMARLGLLSYSIYMVHGPLYLILEKLVKMRGGLQSVSTPEGAHLVIAYQPRIAMDALALACVVAVIAISSLTYRWIERPGQRLLNPKPNLDAASSHGTVEHSPRLSPMA